MNLTKEQALVIYVFMQKHSGELATLTKESSQVRLVCDELQRFLTSSDAAGTHACEGCDGACHSNDTLEMEDEEEVLGEPEASDAVSATDLHDLPQLKTSDGSLEFEHVEGDEVAVIIDSGTELESISRISRTAHSLNVWSRTSNAWTEFVLVGKFPKTWTRLIPALSRVCAVTDE